jgi:hypothetical protein
MRAVLSIKNYSNKINVTMVLFRAIVKYEPVKKINTWLKLTRDRITFELTKPK